MKKIIAFMLALVLALSLCACVDTGSGTEETGGQSFDGLHVGYGREKIMPETSVPLAGYGDTSNRMSTGFLDYLYATCIAISEGDETVLLFSQDLLNSNLGWVTEARKRINEATGIATDRVMLCATHTHSAPDQPSSQSVIAQYRELYMEAVVKAAQDALSDRAPTTLYSTKTKTENMNYVRHYKMSDGTFAGDIFGSFSNGNTPVEHATVGDPEMILVKMDREGDNKDILLMNWQAHPCLTGGNTKTDISADFIGHTRMELEAQTDMHFIYFTGAAGNQNTFSRIETEPTINDVGVFSKKLAQYALDALPNMTKIEGSGLKVNQVQFEYTVNHAKEDMAQIAEQICRVWTTEGTTAADRLARQNGLSSVYEANAIRMRPSRPQVDTMELNAFYVAGMAFITAPYEMFTDSGLYIKENSPFETTVLCTCANNNGLGYFPTEEAYDYGCYESFTSYFAKGCAEATAEQFVTMLEGLQ